LFSGWHLANPPKTSDVHPKIKEQKGKSSSYLLSFVSKNQILLLLRF